MATSLKDSYLGEIPDLSGIANVPAPYYDGFIYGDLDTLMSANSYQDREQVRIYNWRLFRLQAEYCQQAGKILFAKPGNQRIEVHAPETDTMVTSYSNKTLTIEGQGKTVTTLAFYPFALFKQSRDWIETETFNTLNFQGVTLTGVTKFGFETYQGVQTADGLVIDISGVHKYGDPLSGPRSTWLDTIDGKEIFIRVSGSMASNGKDGEDVKTQNRTVVSHTSTTLTLSSVLSSNVSNGVTYPQSDYLNVDLTIALPFEQSVLFSDFETYKESWDDSTFESTLVRHAPNSGNNDPSTINFNDAWLMFFKNGIGRNNGACTLNFDDSNVSDCWETGVSYYSGDYELDAFVNFNQNGGTSCLVTRCGTSLVGVSNRAYVTAGLILGSAMYISPNVRVNVGPGVTVENNFAAAWRQFSATSGSPANAAWTSNYNNTIFRNNDEYGFYASREMQTNLNACQFINNKIANMGYKGVYTNCIFNNCEIIGDDQGQKSSLKNPTLPPYPVPVENQPDLFEVLFDGCVFTDSSWNCVWYGMAKYATIRFHNCQFRFSDSYSLGSFFGGAGGTINTVLLKLQFTGVNTLVDDGISTTGSFRFLTADPIYELDIANGALVFDTVTGSHDWSGLFSNSGLFQVRDRDSVDGTWSAGNAIDQPFYQNVMPLVTVANQASMNIPANLPILWWQFGSSTSITYNGAITNPNP